MNPQLTQLTRYMQTRGRTFRLAPVTGLPLPERFSQIERLVDRLWALSDRFGISLGKKPTVVSTGAELAPPSEALHAVTELEVEVLCTFLVLGLGDVHSRAVFLFANSLIETPSPNFRKIIDECYNIDPSDDMFTD